MCSLDEQEHGLRNIQLGISSDDVESILRKRQYVLQVWLSWYFYSTAPPHFFFFFIEPNRAADKAKKGILVPFISLTLKILLIGFVGTGTGGNRERLRPWSWPDCRWLHGHDESRYQRRAFCQRQRSLQFAAARTRRSQRGQGQDHFWQHRSHLQLAQRVGLSSLIKKKMMI